MAWRNRIALGDGVGRDDDVRVEYQVVGGVGREKSQVVASTVADVALSSNEFQASPGKSGGFLTDQVVEGGLVLGSVVHQIDDRFVEHPVFLGALQCTAQRRQGIAEDRQLLAIDHQ